MSWYTYVYPTDFDYSRYKSMGELQNEIDELRKNANSFWIYICCMAAASPGSMFLNSRDPLKEVIEKFNEKWDRYLDYSYRAERLERLMQYWESKVDHDEYIEKYPNGDEFDRKSKSEMTDEDYKKHLEEERAKWKPYVWYNHFEYTRDPDSGISDTNSQIEQCRVELIMLCSADPKSCIGKSDEEYDVPIEALRFKLNEIKEYLDLTICENYFAKLCLKYKDTIEQG